MLAHPDPELVSLIAEASDAGLLRPGTRAHDVAMRVAKTGQARLAPDDRRVWEDMVLPILAKPLAVQLVVRSMARRAFRLPLGRTLA